MENPKIRFKGFTKDWEQRKLGELVKEGILEAPLDGNHGEKHPTSDEYVDSGIPFLMASDIHNGEVNIYSCKYITKERAERLDKGFARNGDVLLTHKATIGETAILSNLMTEYAMLTPQVTYYRIKNEERLNREYLYSFFNSLDFQTELKTKAAQSTRPYIGITAQQNLKIILPAEIDEQIRIGLYFRNLDHLITLHQRKCDQTKNLKKYMLQKMFPQNGAKVPEIRFDGYTYDWEQRRFGEITELKSASRVHKDEWTSNGVPFYRSSDVMTAINGTENEKAFISEELYEKLSKVSGKLEEGDILVTGGGSVGNPYIVPDNKPLYTKDADLLWIKNKGKFHPYFLYEFFFSPTFRNYLGSISHVGTIAHYTITQLSDTPIGLPIFEEQKEVGEYFQSLDRLITLHQRKCDELKKMKKYMLQNMFI